MITIRAYCMEHGVAVYAKGHADFAPRGQDIVCAGVSALLYGYHAYLTTLPQFHGLREVAVPEDCGVLCISDCGAGLYVAPGQDSFTVISCRLDGEDERAWRVTEAGLRLLAESYPENVRLIDGEQEEEMISSAALTSHEKGGECV